MSPSAIRIGNVLIRFLSMGSRFVLLIALARFLSTAELGHFGLFSAMVLFLVALLGALFYAPTTRALMASDRERWSVILQNSFVGWAIICLALSPGIYWAGSLLFDSPVLTFWLLPVLLIEYLGHETVRVLVAMERPVVASMVTFVRMGGWVWIVIPIMWAVPSIRDLKTVFLAWTLAGALALIIGWLVILQETPTWHRVQIDWTWLRNGFIVGVLYLISTVSHRGLFTLDRFLVEYLMGPDQLGAYVLFIGLAMTLSSLVESAVLTFLSPSLVNAVSRQNLIDYNRILKEITWSSLIIAALFGLGVASISPWLLEWIGKPYYAEHLYLLWILLLMAWFYCAGMVLDSALFASSRDVVIARSAVLGLMAFAVGTIAVIFIDVKSSVAYGLLFSMLVVDLYKGYHLFCTRCHIERSDVLVRLPSHRDLDRIID